MPSSRWLAPVLALTLLTGPPVALAVAQDDATPGADADQTATGDEGFGVVDDPVLGSGVPYLSETGGEIGVITAVEVTDPFDDFSEFVEVEDGTRYVALEVTVAASENAGSAEEPLEANASDFGLQTADGFFYTTRTASRDITSSDVPDLATISIDPGDEVGGLIFFQIPEETELARLFYTPDTGRLILVADLRDAAAGNG